MKKQFQHINRFIFRRCFHLKAAIIIVPVLSCCQISLSQDIHFSQFNMTPLIVNPALSGVFPGDLRTIVNHKNQWSSFGAPYKTYAFSLDAPLFKEKGESNYLGVGFSVFNDVAGDMQLGTTQFNVALSGILLVDEKNSLSVGIMGGIAQHSIKGENLEWGNQFVNGKHDPSQSSREPIESFEPFVYGDAAVGINWNYSKAATDIVSNNGMDLNAGIAAYHLNKPKQKYYQLDKLEKLYSKFVAHAGAQIEIKNKNISFKPSLYYMRQGPAQEITIGLLSRSRLREESRYTGFVKETATLIGVYYRVGDAIIPTMMLELANFTVGLTYDINISGLKEVSQGQGGFEISLRFISPNPFKESKGSRYRHRSLM